MGLKNVVGLSFSSREPVGISCLEKSDKHCHFIHRAREGESFYIQREAISCPLARFYLGMESDIKISNPMSSSKWEAPPRLWMKYEGSPPSPG
jgi:uncharacterized protein (DUF169 family)